MAVFSYQNSLTLDELALEFGMYLWKCDESSFPLKTHRVGQDPDMNVSGSTTGVTFQDSFSTFNATGVAFDNTRTGATEITDNSFSTGSPSMRPQCIYDLTMSVLIKVGTDFGVASRPTIIDGRGNSGETEAQNIFSMIDVGETNNDIRLFWEYGAGLNQGVTSTPNMVDDNSETHIVVTRQIVTKTVKFYKNGALHSSHIYANDPTKAGRDSRIAFGCNTNGGFQGAFNGSIANVMIKPGVLEPDQIQLLYQKQL